MKNILLKTITVLSAIVLMISASMFDSEQLVFPTIVFLVSLMWLLLFALANEEGKGK